MADADSYQGFSPAQVNSGAHARFLALLPGFLAQRRTLVWLLAGALAVRLGAFLAFQRILDFQVAGVIHGSVAYDTYARNLLSTGVYGLTPGLPDAVLPPLYSALVAAVYRTAGRGTLQIVLLNAAFDLLALLALRRIGARLFPPGPAIGTLAAACTAFYPYLVFQSLTVVDTSVFIGLLYCFLATVVALRDVRNGPAIWTRGMFCGVLLGLTTLTRPVTPPLAVFVALWLALTVGWRSAIQRLLPVALGAVVVIAPWVARNSWTFGTPVAITTNAGSNFWQGNNPDTLKYLRAGYDVQWTSPPPITAADPLGPEADAELFRHAMAYLRAQPGDVPALLWTKLRVQWSFDVAPRVNPSAEGPRAAAPGAATARIDDASGTLELGGLPRQEPVVSYSRPLFDRFGRWVHRLYWGGLFLLGILGSLLTWRRWRDVSILWFLAAALTSVYVITHPSTRYRVPGDPGWFLFSSAALLALAGHWPSRRRSLAGGRDAMSASPGSLSSVCWIGSARYACPLGPAAARKWRALADLHVPMHVIAFSDDARPRHFTEHAAFYLVPSLPLRLLRRLIWLLAAPCLLLWIAVRREARLFIAQSPIEGAVASGVKVLLARLGRPVVVVIESHGDFEASPYLYRRVRLRWMSAGLRGRLRAFALRHADLGRAVSAATRQQLQDAAPGLPVDVSPPWIDVEAFACVERSLPPSGSRDVLFAGALVPIKGFHVLLDAFARVSARLEGARVIVAGPEPTRAYAAALGTRIAESGLASRIEFVKEVGSRELAGLMAGARVVVVPSLSEGLSRVALEAMLVGTPVIASRVGGLPEVVSDGDTGWLVPPDDPAALAEALVRAFENCDVDAMGARARALSRRGITVGAFIEGHRRLFAAAGLPPAVARPPTASR